MENGAHGLPMVFAVKNVAVAFNEEIELVTTHLRWQEGDIVKGVK